MLHSIAEQDKAYGKWHHIPNPFKSNETSHFYQIILVFTAHNGSNIQQWTNKVNLAFQKAYT